MKKTRSVYTARSPFFKRAKRDFNKVVKKPGFARAYVLASVLTLATTTLVWSILGSRLNNANADQLADPFLFKGSGVLHVANLPSAHSQLLKWPIFWLVGLFGNSAAAFTFFSTLCALATVGGLAYVIHKIDRRPMTFGTLCLALASVLLLVPIVPAPGTLLPMNMAMLATRNIEYIAYMFSLWLMISGRVFKSARFWWGAALLGILCASDHLFIILSAGGALLALIIYSWSKNRELYNLASRWLVAAVGSAIGGLILLGVIGTSGLVHIGSSDEPYHLVHGIKDLSLGMIYGLMGLLTNFGANPGHSAFVVKNIPAAELKGLVSSSAVATILNLCIFIAGIWAVFKLFKISLKKQSLRGRSQAQLLALALGVSSLAAIGSFILTNHYYAVDGRYLTVTVFSVFITFALIARQKKVQPANAAAVGILLFIGIVGAMPSAIHAYSKDKSALSALSERNQTVEQILTRHKEDVLVGDYWRVLPIKLAAPAQTVMPLSDCANARTSLSSQAWQLNLATHSFAYLLTLSGSLTDFPNCSLNQVINAFGRPNASALIAGSEDNPSELLLFYDKGSGKSAPKVPLKTPSTVLPIPLSQLPYTNCPEGTSIMNIVAHQDDDLLFMNPDTKDALNSGHCIRTVYITAGDSGQGSYYWLGREQGAEAAYSYMLGSKDIWVQRIVKLSNKEYIQVAHPKSDYRVSLIFFRLPDGNLNGEGFRANLYQSLEKLQGGQISQMVSVDNQSIYSYKDLSQALAQLLQTFSPSEVHTQAGFVGKQYPDHSDHLAVGQIVKKSGAIYSSTEFDGTVTIPVKYYIGYPIHSMPANVGDGALSIKQATFAAYGAHDGSVCHSSECDRSVYGIYLARQYQNNY